MFKKSSIAIEIFHRMDYNKVKIMLKGVFTMDFGAIISSLKNLIEVIIETNFIGKLLDFIGSIIPFILDTLASFIQLIAG